MAHAENVRKERKKETKHDNLVRVKGFLSEVRLYTSFKECICWRLFARWLCMHGMEKIAIALNKKAPA